jgi:hypothetical protein
MLWFCVRSSRGVQAPAWKRSIAVKRDGTVFVAAAIGGKEKDVSLSTLSGRTPVLLCFDHVYVPMAWMVEHFPMCKARCREMVSAALFSLQKTLNCRDTWNRFSCFCEPSGEKTYLGYVL